MGDNQAQVKGQNIPASCFLILPNKAGKICLIGKGKCAELPVLTRSSMVLGLPETSAIGQKTSEKQTDKSLTNLDSATSGPNCVGRPTGIVLWP